LREGFLLKHIANAILFCAANQYLNGQNVVVVEDTHLLLECDAQSYIRNARISLSPAPWKQEQKPQIVAQLAAD